MAIKAPKGTKDITPDKIYKWHYIENIIKDLTSLYNYTEIRTPVFEHTELFLRGVGETTDIVQKEMYTFEDKGARSITLRPEGTAGVVRAFIENGIASMHQPTKLYYLSAPVFRYERPQSGRLREHHQFGVEVFGSALPDVDAEVISLALNVLNKIGLYNLTLKINSIGCGNCRPLYYKELKSYLSENKDNLCATCRQRMETNPLRVLDCKEESCKNIVSEAPKIINYLCDDCREHFEMLKHYLDVLGISYEIDSLIVRGLDYYTKTVFEITTDSIGAQGTVCGGGRYDNLIKQIGGPDMPGIGFGMGIERLLLVIENENIDIPGQTAPEVYICPLGDKAKDKAIKLLSELRAIKVKSDMDHLGRSIKAAMKYANKIQAQKVIIIGDEELKNNCLKLKNMTSGEEITDSYEKVIRML